jgi:hypothetical protein
VDCAAPQVAGTFFSARKLQRILDRRGRIPHRSLINDIVAETAIGVQSPLEYRWIQARRSRGYTGQLGRCANCTA